MLKGEKVSRNNETQWVQQNIETTMTLSKKSGNNCNMVDSWGWIKFGAGPACTDGMYEESKICLDL